jgi:hypothetical protein
MVPLLLYENSKKTRHGVIKMIEYKKALKLEAERHGVITYKETTIEDNRNEKQKGRNKKDIKEAQKESCSDAEDKHDSIQEDIASPGRDGQTEREACQA